MRYLIDGHNLIPKIPGLSLAAVDDELHLIDWLQIFSRRKRKEVEVFFDQAPAGVQARRKYGLVTAHFVRQGRTADAAIQARLLQLGKQAKSCIVVSSDRQVQASARSVHAQLISAEDFARQLLNQDMNPSGEGQTDGDADRLPEGRLSEREVDEWLALFKRGRPGKEEKGNQELR